MDNDDLIWLALALGVAWLLWPADAAAAPPPPDEAKPDDKKVVAMSISPATVIPGGAYQVTAPALANQLVDVRATVDNEAPFTIASWIRFDAAGKATVVLPTTQRKGVYRMTAIRIHGETGWSTTAATVTVAAAPPPSAATPGAPSNWTGGAGNSGPSAALQAFWNTLPDAPLGATQAPAGYTFWNVPWSPVWKLVKFGEQYNTLVSLGG